MTRDDESLIEHILTASRHLAEIVEAGREDFNASWLLRSAAEHQMVSALWPKQDCRREIS